MQTREVGCHHDDRWPELEAEEGSRSKKRRRWSYAQESKDDEVGICRPDSLPIYPLTQRLENVVRGTCYPHPLRNLP
jgi:hypothetical protein